MLRSASRLCGSGRSIEVSAVAIRFIFAQASPGCKRRNFGCGACSRSNYFLYEARGILRGVRRRVNRMTAYEPCEYFGKVENAH